MSINFIGVLLPSSPNYTVNTGFSTELYDAEGSQTITVEAGASLSLQGALGANTVRLSGNASTWQVYRDGSTAIFVNANDGSRVEMAANTTAQTLQFDDGTRGLSIDISGAMPAVVLGSQTLSLSAAAISADTGTPTTPTEPTEPDVGSTVQTPWTLVMHASNDGASYPSSSGIFTSDGTAAATGLTTLDGLGSASNYSSDMGVQFNTNADQTKAYFYEINRYSSGSNGVNFGVGTVGVTDGTAAGTATLMSAASGRALPGNFATVVNNQLILAGGSAIGWGIDVTGQVLVSDGSVAGTTLHATEFAVPSLSNDGVIQDDNGKTVWFGGTSTPYGWEIVRFNHATDASPATTMVKDIYPGSSGSLGSNAYYSSPLTGAVLPDGKLVFSANDGVHGAEAWVSDGTDTGTFMLADLYTYSNSGSGPSSFTSFGDKVVFTAYVNDAPIYGYQLVLTDGTSTGTTVLDVNPGSYITSPTIVGQANGLLYFTATTGGDYNSLTGTTSAQVTGIFSTDGSTFNRLADINSSASLLGWDASTAFFSVSDVAHGAELWAADLVSGDFALVKDILPGSGSALASNYGSPAFMVGGKLAFSAYTSATAQSFFLSDGTEAGTVQLTNGLPTLTKVIDNTLVYANADGVFSVAADSATPAAVELISAAAAATVNPGYTTQYPSNGQIVSHVENDLDQVFLQLVNGDLYASNGNTAGTVKLAGAVSNFKMVAEDALFFIQSKTTSSTTSQSLWYSDGTATGTRFIEDLPIGSYALDNAVAIVTVGIAI